MGIIGAHFTGRARATAFAAFSAGAPVGAGVGLTIGGVLTAYTSTTWRGCLWLIAAIATCIGVVGFFYIPPDQVTTSDKRIDWVGAALVTVGLIFLQFVISDGQGAPQGWSTPCENLRSRLWSTP